jgi:hypothetical protein
MFLGSIRGYQKVGLWLRYESERMAMIKKAFWRGMDTLCRSSYGLLKHGSGISVNGKTTQTLSAFYYIQWI